MGARGTTVVMKGSHIGGSTSDNEGWLQKKKKEKEEEEEAKGIKNDSRGQNGKRRRSNEKMKVSDFFVFERKMKLERWAGERRF